MATQEECVERASDESKWSCPHDRVRHLGDAGSLFKLVNVSQRLERTAKGLVDEAVRPIHLHDAGRQTESHPEVTPFEGHLVAELQQAGGPTRAYDPFVRESRGRAVNVDVPREIEAPLGWSSNARLKNDFCHALTKAAGRRRAVVRALGATA